MKESKIRVGIRGVAGLLGSRIAAAIQRTNDIKLEVGVVLPDRTLETLLNRRQFLPQFQCALPKQLFVQVPNHTGGESEIVRQLNARGQVRFQGVSQLSWRKSCDVIIDNAYPAGKEVVEEQYRAFPGIVILQDGAAPEGRLIVPPLTAPDAGQGNRYRMGDCILSGLVPLLYPLRDIAKTVRVHLLTQFDGRESDYLITERAHAFYVRDDLRVKVTKDLGVLFPDQEIDVEAVIQIPSLLHYQLTLSVELREAINHNDLRYRLGTMPRVRLVPSGVTSTYDVNLARSFSDEIPPIVVFESSLEPGVGASSMVRIVAALYYRTAAVLPNLDSIRILAQGMDPIEAMRQTDRDMGFKT
ncbi:MAG: hypothetical protein WC621_02125 [Patescibacteria group bacterium]